MTRKTEKFHPISRVEIIRLGLVNPKKQQMLISHIIVVFNES